MAKGHKLTKEDRAKGGRVAAENARQRLAERLKAEEAAGLLTPGIAAARAEASRQVAEERLLRGRVPRDRVTDVSRALLRAGYKTTFDPADFGYVKGEYSTGRHYLETDYAIVVKNSDGTSRVIEGRIRSSVSSRAELRAAIFKKEGESEFDTGDVEAVLLPDDLDFS